jgi:hypothetical protein
VNELLNLILAASWLFDDLLGCVSSAIRTAGRRLRFDLDRACKFSCSGGLMSDADLIIASIDLISERPFDRWIDGLLDWLIG